MRLNDLQLDQELARLLRSEQAVHRVIGVLARGLPAPWELRAQLEAVAPDFDFDHPLRMRLAPLDLNASISTIPG